MTTPHRATPDQWHNLLQYRKLGRRIPDHVSVTLELADPGARVLRVWREGEC